MPAKSWIEAPPAGLKTANPKPKTAPDRFLSGTVLKFSRRRSAGARAGRAESLLIRSQLKRIQKLDGRFSSGAGECSDHEDFTLIGNLF